MWSAGRSPTESSWLRERWSLTENKNKNKTWLQQVKKQGSTAMLKTRLFEGGKGSPEESIRTDRWMELRVSGGTFDCWSEGGSDCEQWAEGQFAACRCFLGYSEVRGGWVAGGVANRRPLNMNTKHELPEKFCTAPRGCRVWTWPPPNAASCSAKRRPDSPVTTRGGGGGRTVGDEW